MLNKDEILDLQKQLHMILDGDLVVQRTTFEENSQDPHAKLLGVVSVNLQNAMNALGKIIESFDSEA